MRIEVFIHATDYDLSVITNQGPMVPVKISSDRIDRVKKDEEYNTEDHELIQKCTKPKDMLYRGLQKSVLYKVSSCHLRNTYGIY